MKNNKIIFKYIGKVLITYAFFLLCPILVALIYNESTLPFIIPAIISLISGLLLNRLKPDNKSLYAKEGFIIVALSWILISLIASLPYIINKDANILNSIFEAVSGLTTTGITIFTNVESLNKSILFFRNFNVYIGGMGVLAFVMAIIPLSQNDKSMHVLKAEMPGPNISKLVPSIKKTLLYLFGIYFTLTILVTIFLMIGGLNFFDSLLISFSTVGTSGTSQFNDGLASLSNFNIWVVIIGMILSGINFNIYFLLLMKEFKVIFHSEELRTYLMICIVSIVFVTANTFTMFDTIGEAIRQSALHMSSVITSAGFNIGDISIYPTSCRVLCLLLMLVGACAGSTCGGFKISRLIICIKSIARDLLKTIKPNLVKTIKFEGKNIEEDTVDSVRAFIFLYIIIIMILTFLISYDGYSLEITLNAAISTFTNSGINFGIKSFDMFSNLSKISMTLGMLFGRLEIFPMIVLLTNLRKK